MPIKNKSDWYTELQQKISDSIEKEDARARAIRRKREERNAVKKAGGGVNVAKRLLSGGKRIMANEESITRNDDTDFSFGHNENLDSPQHSSQDNEQPDGCMGQVSCKKCGKFHGYCREVEEEKEKNKMLPSGEQTSTKTTGRKGGLNWLKPEHLSTQSQEAKILMVKYQEQGQWGARVNLKLAFAGEIFYMGVSPTKKDPRYKALIETFGTQENDWVDQRIHLFLEQDPFTEAYQIRVGFPEKKGKK